MINKSDVRHKVHNAIKNGKLKKLPCEICGNREKIEAHHEDYNKPLEVVWLCNGCHSAITFTKTPSIIKKVRIIFKERYFPKERSVILNLTDEEYRKFIEICLIKRQLENEFLENCIKKII